MKCVYLEQRHLFFELYHVFFVCFDLLSCKLMRLNKLPMNRETSSQPQIEFHLFFTTNYMWHIKIHTVTQTHTHTRNKTEIANFCDFCFHPFRFAPSNNLMTFVFQCTHRISWDEIKTKRKEKHWNHTDQP